MESQPCAQCGAPFLRYRRDHRFCSSACREKGKSRRGTSQRCDWCWADFINNARGKNAERHRYCSQQCRGLDGRTKAIPIPWAVCTVCSIDVIWRRTGVPFCGHCLARHVAAERAAQRDRDADDRHERSRKRRAALHGAESVPYSRLDIFIRDGWVCQICRKKVRRRATWPHPQSPSIDHIIPLSQGGSDAPVNVQCVHALCNWRKNAKTAPGGDQLRLVG